MNRPDSRFFLFVDPGIHGAYCLRGSPSGWMGVWSAPEDVREYPSIVSDIAKVHQPLDVIMETVGPRPWDTPTTAWGLSRSVASWEIACFQAGLKIHYVDPKRWQNALGIDLPKGRVFYNLRKNKLWEVAQGAFPGRKITKQQADAVCISMFLIGNG